MGGELARRSGVFALWNGAMAAWFLAPFSGAQEPRAAERVFEGPLENDTVLESSRDAELHLAQGDIEWKGGRTERAFDAWREALIARGANACVTAPEHSGWPDPDGTLPRRAEAVAWAVERRLALIPADARRAWSARFADLARTELAGAGRDPARLAAVAGANPRTVSAARAALCLADLALEEGDASAARMWLDRVAADELPDAADIPAAIARRRELMTRLRDENAEASEDLAALDAANTLVRGSGLDHENKADSSNPHLASEPVFDARGEAWIQRADHVLRVNLSGPAALAVDLDVDLRRGPPEGLNTWITAFGEDEAPWPERPAITGARFVVIAGRARAEHGNALVAFTTASGAAFAWAWTDGARVGPSGALESDRDLLGPGLVEFEPGPLIIGPRVVVHARRYSRGEENRSTAIDEAHVEAWLVALELESGAVLWKQRIASGTTARGRERGRNDAAAIVSQSSPPLARDGDRIAVDTGLGVLALVDLVDGRVAWSVRIARGSSGPARRLCTFEGGIAAAPADAGDILYRLRPEADRDGRGLFKAAPLRIAHLADLAGGGPDPLVVMERRAGRLVAGEIDLDRGGERISLPVAGPASRLGTAAAVGRARVLVAADGELALFDRGHEMRRIASLPLETGPPDPSAGPIGLAVRGRIALVVSPTRIERVDLAP